MTSSIQSPLPVVALKFGVVEDTEWTHTPGSEEGPLSDSASVGSTDHSQVDFYGSVVKICHLPREMEPAVNKILKGK